MIGAAAGAGAGAAAGAGGSGDATAASDGGAAAVPRRTHKCSNCGAKGCRKDCCDHPCKQCHMRTVRVRLTGTSTTRTRALQAAVPNASFDGHAAKACPLKKRKPAQPHKARDGVSSQARKDKLALRNRLIACDALAGWGMYLRKAIGAALRAARGRAEVFEQHLDRWILHIQGHHHTCVGQCLDYGPRHQTDEHALMNLAALATDAINKAELLLHGHTTNHAEHPHHSRLKYMSKAHPFRSSYVLRSNMGILDVVMGPAVWRSRVSAALGLPQSDAAARWWDTAESTSQIISAHRTTKDGKYKTNQGRMRAQNHNRWARADMLPMYQGTASAAVHREASEARAAAKAAQRELSVKNMN